MVVVGGQEEEEESESNTRPAVCVCLCVVARGRVSLRRRSLHRPASSHFLCELALSSLPPPPLMLLVAFPRYTFFIRAMKNGKNSGSPLYPLCKVTGGRGGRGRGRRRKLCPDSERSARRAEIARTQLRRERRGIPVGPRQGPCLDMKVEIPGHSGSASQTKRKTAQLGGRWYGGGGGRAGGK